jgi:hypothetical protein
MATILCAVEHGLAASAAAAAGLGSLVLANLVTPMQVLQHICLQWRLTLWLYWGSVVFFCVLCCLVWRCARRARALRAAVSYFDYLALAVVSTCVDMSQPNVASQRLFVCLFPALSWCTFPWDVEYPHHMQMGSLHAAFRAK